LILVIHIILKSPCVNYNDVIKNIKELLNDVRIVNTKSELHKFEIYYRKKRIAQKGKTSNLIKKFHLNSNNFNK